MSYSSDFVQAKDNGLAGTTFYDSNQKLIERTHVLYTSVHIET
jgi:hypothetical protein